MAAAVDNRCVVADSPEAMSVAVAANQADAQAGTVAVEVAVAQPRLTPVRSLGGLAMTTTSVIDRRYRSTRISQREHIALRRRTRDIRRETTELR